MHHVHLVYLGNGHYLLMESSVPATNGSQFLLLSPDVTSAEDRCYSFWYYMYGNETGSLAVSLLDKSNTHRTAWQLSGDQGQGWKEGVINLLSNDTARVCYKYYFVFVRHFALSLSSDYDHNAK